MDASRLAQLYHQMADNTAGVPAECLKKTQEGYFRLLQRHSPLAGELMELGPDIGLFTEWCVKEGNFSHFWLFEPNQSVHPQLEKAVNGSPHTVSTEMMNYGEIPDRRLSLAVMVHVLDHLLTPKQNLEDIRLKMKPGAILLLVTHDESSWLARCIKNRWPPYGLAHPQLFNPDSIRNLLTSAGYGVLEIHRTYNYFPFLELLRRVLSVGGIQQDFLPKSSLFPLRLKLGNIATLARVPE